MKGSMSYPTAVIMMENFQNPQVQAGYMDVNQLETILTYFGDNAFKHQSGTDYQKTYKPRWANGQVADMTPPAGH
jgi:thioredoxin-related protein